MLFEKILFTFNVVYPKTKRERLQLRNASVQMIMSNKSVASFHLSYTYVLFVHVNAFIRTIQQVTRYFLERVSTSAKNDGTINCHSFYFPCSC